MTQSPSQHVLMHPSQAPFDAKGDESRKQFDADAPRQPMKAALTCYHGCRLQAHSSLRKEHPTKLQEVCQHKGQRNAIWCCRHADIGIANGSMSGVTGSAKYPVYPLGGYLQLQLHHSGKIQTKLPGSPVT